MDILAPLRQTHRRLPPPPSSPSLFPLPDLDHPDFLSVDDLLNFSDDDIAASIQPPSSPSPPSPHSNNPSLPLPSSASASASAAAAALDDSDALCVPCDELAELEWLSNFVEESFSCGSSAIAGCGGKEEMNAKDETNLGGEAWLYHQSKSPVSVLQNSGDARGEEIRGAAATATATASASVASCSPDMSSFRGRARSKRRRSAGGVCFWNSRILSAEPSESILEASSTTSTVTAASSDSDMFTTYYEEEEDEEGEEDGGGTGEGWGGCSAVSAKWWMKKQQQRKRREEGGAAAAAKKWKGSIGGGGGAKEEAGNGGGARKCLHCGSQKTPQWRAGPLGPKTLCNACGVRYKSGRLCPEYRPAASPTFDHLLHSNSHRKVLEMRRLHGDAQPPAGASSSQD